MRKFLQLTIILVFIIAANNFAQAQDSISPEKRKLIAELVTLTKADTQVVKITDIMLASMGKTYPLIIKQTLEGNGQLDKIEQDKLAARMNASFQSFSKKFRERLPKEIDYGQFIKDTVYPLYDKYFTEKELADLVAFYKTETGQKIVSTMPELFAESTAMSEKFLLPKVLELVDKIVKEELDTFAAPTNENEDNN
ncbi:MAG: DUF2059 domain-containing protein [Aridibacter sp.]